MRVDYEISDQALEGLVLHALEGVEGARPLEALPRSLGEVFRRVRPVKVERSPEGFAVDLVLAVDYGVAIPELARTVQKAVAEALFLATGERVRAVNVTVAQVEYPRGGHAQAG
ncbi:Asp23/Gls24 family envelope stress response protein [Thermus thermamylovorans]|uniref:Asp23/Gls24 family envelope stress response protein n=1 Tax=Thermus thermamylovorans TaxID=2509362 RepID=A0A4Q9B6Y3_9DEIN|nr:Asp23/Gls24 family envelope stress response protein [Thermus thermamylovorans]TBH21895.1 Asp23/Gls24 family envelope stress response protein [Thermus thermamylovorans]